MESVRAWQSRECQQALAEHVLERIRKGEGKTLRAEEMWRGLED